jgi:UvrD-like helicase C-terminal domain
MAQAQRALGPYHEEELGERDDLGDTWQQRRLGALFARCVTELEQAGALPRFDAIIIDEAQDIERPLWTPLYKLLRDRRNGRFLAFYDPAQRLDERDWSPPIPSGYRELVLTDNCRNTQAIFSVSHQFYMGLDVPLCVGPGGRPVRCLDPAGDLPIPTTNTSAAIEVQALERTLDTLIAQEGVTPREILVVTWRSKKASVLYGLRMVGRHQLTSELGTRNPKAVRIVTVRSAKGLVAPVVIVAELHGLDRVGKRSHYLYVATSRAQHHLIVLASQDALLPQQPSLATTLLQPPIISS